MSHPEEQAAATNTNADVVELLRVTLLSLEGIELSNETLHGCSNDLVAVSNNHWRITAWAGFRSSFPTGCLSVPTSHYSTIFQREGNNNNFLAVESDQIELDDTSSSSIGRFHWQDSMQYDEREPSNDGGVEEEVTKTTPQHHLQVVLPSQPTHHDAETTPSCDDMMLPDIIEIHVCIACNLINSQLEDCTDEKGQDTSFITKEEHYSHGIAHLKIPSREQYTENNLDLLGFSRPGGKVVMLPIQTKLPTNDSDNTLATFAHNAILSMRVEKSTVPTERYRNCIELQRERHYIESDWNGESCAPASINSFESQGKGTHILRAGQIISGIRQTFSSQVSNLRKSHDDEEPISNDDSKQANSAPLRNKSFSQLFKLTCGELGDVLQGDEMGMYDQSNTIDSSLATADVLGD